MVESNAFILATEDEERITKNPRLTRVRAA